jgi:uncharacterized membrane protein YdjX (TVP38/TMEM64 family)
MNYVSSLGDFGYFDIFIAGICFSFGFSTPFAIGFFIISNPSNILLAALIGGLGALVSDLLIFKIIRFSFMDEFKRLKKSRPIVEVDRMLDSHWIHGVKNYLLFVFAGLVIASPLPDELGVSMLAGLTRIKVYLLAIISFIMNSFGIFIMLLIGS